MLYATMEHENINTVNSRGKIGQESFGEQIHQNSAETSELIKREYHNIIQMKVQADLKLQELNTALEEAEKLASNQATELQEIQIKNENVTQLYNFEQSKRQDIEQRMVNVGFITEVIQEEYGHLKTALNNMSKDKDNLAAAHKSYEERLANMMATRAKNEQLHIEQYSKLQRELTDKELILSTKNELIAKTNESYQQLIADHTELKSVFKTESEKLQQQKNISDDYAKQLEHLKISSNSKHGDLQQKIEEARNDLTFASKQTEELKTEVGILKSELNHRMDEIKHLEVVNETHKTQSVDWNQQIKTLSDKIFETETSAVENMKQYETNYNKLITENVQISDNVKALEKELQESQIKVDELKIELNKQYREIATYEEKIGNQNNAVEILKTNELKYIEEVQQLKQDLEASQLITAQLQHELLLSKENHQKLLDSEKEKVIKVDEELVTVRKELAQHKEMHKVVLNEYQEALVRSETASNKKLEEITMNLTESKAKFEKLKKQEVAALLEKMSVKEIEIEKLEIKLKTCDSEIVTNRENMSLIQKENEKLRASITRSKRRLEDKPSDVETVTSQTQNSLHGNKIRHANRNHSSNCEITFTDTDSNSEASFQVDPELLKRRANFFKNTTVKRKAESSSPALTKKISTTEGLVNMLNSSLEPEACRQYSSQYKPKNNNRFFKVSNRK